MRIFTAIRHSNDPAQFYGGLWSSNFYPALAALGHEVVESKIDLLPLSRFMEVEERFTGEELEVRARLTQQILDEVVAAHQKAPIHLFLSYFYNAHFDPSGFAELRRRGIPSVNFYCNSIYQFGLVASIARHVDVSWHAERDAAPFYRAVGAKPVWVQMAADPDVCHPVAGVARTPKACFVGQRYADRAKWVAAIVRAGVPLDVYGVGWREQASVAANRPQLASDRYLGRRRYRPGSLRSYANSLGKTLRRQGVVGGIRRAARQWRYRSEAQSMMKVLSPCVRGFVPSGKMPEVFAGAAVCLNFSNVWADGQPGAPLIPHVRLRDFEGPMSRTCYLTGYTDEIAQFYEIGREIDTYENEDELIDKLRFYLSHEEAAERLRAAGYLRARRDHTWRRRFEQLFKALEAVGVC